MASRSEGLPEVIRIHSVNTTSLQLSRINKFLLIELKKFFIFIFEIDNYLKLDNSFLKSWICQSLEIWEACPSYWLAVNCYSLLYGKPLFEFSCLWNYFNKCAHVIFFSIKNIYVFQIIYWKGVEWCFWRLFALSK